LNRIDDIIVFHALGTEHLKKIVEIQLDGLRARLAERHITIELTDDAIAYLVHVGHEPGYGARPLKRAIQRELETALAKRILGGDVRDGSHVRIGFDANAGALRFDASVAQPVGAE
jgi:ATP-dependent Clp protease ATP-binding subunit ClpB